VGDPFLREGDAVKTRWVRLGGLLVATVILLAACGGGGGDGGGDGGEGGGGGDGGAATVAVTGSEFKYDPSTLSAPADTEVTVELTNAGTIEHDFSLDEANLKVLVQATETQTGTFNLPAGTYTFYCSVPGHREAGMEGTLTVS
jgi:uncharacterized cupredoxin-like copper-binding protein